MSGALSHPAEFIVADVGGTNARFALASITADGAITIGNPIVFATSDLSGLNAAWTALPARLGRPLPTGLALAVAAPISGPVIRMTNASWQVDTRCLTQELSIARLTVVNDFAAVAHAVAAAPEGQLSHLFGPDMPLPDTGAISVIGPGTGLGVACLHRFAAHYHVQATEGGHAGFAPDDVFDDSLLAMLRGRHGRVSMERVVSGPGIVAIYEAIARQENHTGAIPDDRTIWQSGLAGNDRPAVMAIHRFCVLLGRVAGDYILCHGAQGLVITGNIVSKLAGILPRSGFVRAFCDKGRYAAFMAGVPVKVLTMAEPGLYGAAVAFIGEHGPV